MSNKVDPSKFKIGDRVAFTDYYHHTDEYLKRNGQSAIIIERKANGDFGIVWDDGRHSGVWQDENFWGMYKVNNDGESIMKPYERKTYRLRVETPSMKKGAILQEQCDDGTQPYIVLNEETHSKDPSYKISFAKRELVEAQPRFFEEVFAVTPAFMNASEIAAWESFKKAQAKKGKK